MGPWSGAWAQVIVGLAPILMDLYVFDKNLYDSNGSGALGPGSWEGRPGPLCAGSWVPEAGHHDPEHKRQEPGHSGLARIRMDLSPIADLPELVQIRMEMET